MRYRQVWAPNAESVELCLTTGRIAMTQTRNGWWTAATVELGHGGRYGFAVDGGPARPDPRSHWQPDGVHELSAYYDHSRFTWTDSDWRGLPLAGAVIYELHVGTFTEEGTLDAAVGRLDHLVRLGVSIVELMPVAAYDGHHGWGYDGVVLGAVHPAYGGPDGLKRFVDACHRRGLGICLDVVYNHLGPSGNYLREFGPYFTDRYVTPWGAAINLDDEGSDEVRRFLLDNAHDWFVDFHVDALRLDAVHALHDERALHLLEELAAETDALASTLGRPLWLIAESDRNDVRTVMPREAGGLGVHAQWNDDVHHALHALLTGERDGYYADFGSPEMLAKTLTRVFWHDGTWSSFRRRSHGRPVDPYSTPGWRFVAALNNHDQIGNRAAGDRPAAGLDPGMLAIGAGLLLTSPYTPMLFMGEEWAAETPWQFFTDFADPALGAAVRSGRRREFEAYGWAPQQVPDPQDRQTFERSKLNWAELDKAVHARMLQWYCDLLRLRRDIPALSDPRLDHVRVDFDEAAGWLRVDRSEMCVVANLAEQSQEIALDGLADRVVLAWDPASTRLTAESVQLGPHALAIVETRKL